ncbi:hypothetical protein H310_11366 [Aphanomyces invadans]|uniref:Tail specific protease domain-containing protein n=1 Tax=Aphanomyces invadans TaxID=157072 RepID=A0A024TNZ5_9STRA|nr:hypothetical protein H310_11366 [Aphanomyces invadans]ETV95072.1 hypothetical protein H310_11366 [Aphanomyces invadans]|eukprot:XP_008876245.1 hypothetical protein H310_11366 [Aphanomyces invadans]
MLRRRCSHVEAATGAVADFAQNLVVLLVPPCEATRRGWMHAVVLYPLQCVESIFVRPLGHLRRHMPLLGGICVVALTLWSMLLRNVWRHVHHTLTTLSASSDPRLNFDTFWNAVEAYYVFTDASTCNWPLVHVIFGDKIDTSTSEDDLWTAIVDSMALLGDPSVRLLHPQACESLSHSSQNGMETTLDLQTPSSERSTSLRPTSAHLEFPPLVQVAPRISTLTLTQSSRTVLYVRLDAMVGFVDRSFPLDLLSPPSQPAAVPELFDVEAMRWALQSVVRPLLESTKNTGVILDLRWNHGGGSPQAALAAAAMFLPPRTPAFEIEEPLKTWGRVRRRTFHVPSAAASESQLPTYYNGPLVVLQSAHTAGTAELLVLALRHRKRTKCIGDTTAGRASGLLQIQLPNGWLVELPHQRCSSAGARGAEVKCVHGRGLKPHVPVDLVDGARAWSTALDVLYEL